MDSMETRVADALERAEFGYSLSLTRLVDGVATYTLEINGEDPMEFEDNSEAYDYIAKRKRSLMARAAIGAMREPSDEAIDAGRTAGPVVLVEREVGKPWPRCLLADEVRSVFSAMIDAALTGSPNPKMEAHWHTAPQDDLPAAIRDFKAALPGWWYSVAECQVSCDASCAPTVESADSALIREAGDQFDAGFDVDLPQPSTLAAALRDVMRQAIEARSNARRPKHP